MTEAARDDARLDALERIGAALARGERARALVLAFGATRAVEQPALMQRVAADLARERGFEPDAGSAPELWRRYGALSARAGHLDDARIALDLALALEPDAYSARIDAGTVAFMRADLDVAKIHFERATALRPGEAEPLATLAAVAARQQRHADARDLAQRALALRPGLVTAQMAIARADLLEGLVEGADARMSELLASSALNDAQRVGALDLRADARDALDRPAQAFADYAARNAILARVNAPRIAAEVRERRIDQALRLERWFGNAAADAWRTPADGDAAGSVRGHVFLLGFPRSGTTLLEKALACHPEISTLEEIDHLAGVGAELLADDAGLHRLATLGAAAADAVRASYWGRVEASVGVPLAGRVLVDKLPLHTLALPLVARLFPRAKILFALRDPRDVVLSCFRRRFQVNAAMFEFLTLEGAARYYAAVMALARTCRAVLPLDVHEVRHERVVADFEGEVRKVLAFIGADWNPVVHGFAERARARAVTPSDVQLASGLNAQGVGQWRRYEASLAPVLPLLEPWVRHFGYDDAPR